VKGLVLDHGGRHPGMPKKLSKVRILTLNYDLEYQKSEVNSSFHYNSAEQREKMVAAERKWVDDKTQLILDLKAKVCQPGETMLLVNQKGIDPLALDMLAREGVLALRRAKRRNMERICKACGGEMVTTLDGMDASMVGYAEEVYEQTLGEDSFTFIEGVTNAFSCTIMIKGAHKHVIEQIKDAVRDGLRAVYNAMMDSAMVLGAGGFETQAHAALMEYQKTVAGRAKLGVQAYAEALLTIPKTLAENAGYDAQDTMIKLQEKLAAGSKCIGLDVTNGEPMDPDAAGIWDNFAVKRQMLDSAAVISAQLLLVDEVIRAGKQMKKSG